MAGSNVYIIRYILQFLIKKKRDLKLTFLEIQGQYVSDDTVHFVDPQKIVFATIQEFYIHKFMGMVKDGEWDRLEKRFENLDFFFSYRDRVLKGTRWEQLPYYWRVLKEIEEGKEKWGCKSRQDLDLRCKRLDEIFEDIKKNGYKDQISLKEQRDQKIGPVRGAEIDYDEVTVNIGRDGDLLFNDGRHRLTMAKIAGLREIPVRIVVRHAQWMEFKKILYRKARRNKGHLFPALTHIDLQDVPFDTKGSEWEIINSNLGNDNKTVLDIKAHWGYFCHKFEENGFRCFAVEDDIENQYLLRKLKKAENKGFSIIQKSIFDFAKEEPLNYDIVLALSSFPKSLGDQCSPEQLKVLLNNMNMKEMYISSNLYRDSIIGSGFYKLKLDSLLEFIIHNSCLKYYKLIGYSKRKIPIYKIWR